MRRLVVVGVIVTASVGCAPQIKRKSLDEKSYYIGMQQTARVGQAILQRTTGEQAQAKIWTGLAGGGWKDTEWAPLSGSVKEELLYQGGNESEIKLGYREYRLTKDPLETTPVDIYGNVSYRWNSAGFLAAPAFYQQLEYKREQGPTTIAFSRYRIRVMSADNEAIVYVVESD